MIDGRKFLITNAGAADFYVFAKTDAAAGSRGISCFLVEADTPGCEFAGAQILSEPHPLGELRFEKCRVPAGNLLGKEGEGFKLGMATLDRLRPTVAAAACGFAARALAEALAHAKQRRQFGKPLAEQPILQQKLAIMATELDAARLLTFRAAWEADRGKSRITGEAAVAKASPPKRRSASSTTRCKSWAAAAAWPSTRSTASTARCAPAAFTKGPPKCSTW